MKVSLSYWRVIFENGPVNLLDPDSIDQLSALIGRIESEPDPPSSSSAATNRVSLWPIWDFLADNARVAAMQPGPMGLHPYVDNFVRLSRLPVATISEIRGRTRGAAASSARRLTSVSRLRRRSWASSRSALVPSPEVGLWRGLDVWLAAAARWRSCSAAMTFPRAWPLSTVT